VPLPGLVFEEEGGEEIAGAGLGIFGVADTGSFDSLLGPLSESAS